MTVKNSFFNISILAGINEFIGFKNYLKVFSDPKVLTSISFTAIFVVASMIFHVILGVILALILNMKFKGRRFLRTIVLIPWAMPAVVAGMEASYKAFDRYPARKDVAEKVVPDTDPAKEMYSQYAEECNVQGRPLVAQTMEFISDMGTIFQSCMKDEITVDEFCKKAQEVVDTYQ